MQYVVDGKIYSDKKAADEAEAKFNKALEVSKAEKKKVAVSRKADAEAIEKKHDELMEVTKNYNKVAGEYEALMNAFARKYGSYHCSYFGGDAVPVLHYSDMLNWLFDRNF